MKLSCDQRLTGALLALGGLAFLAACGGSSDASGTGGASGSGSAAISGGAGGALTGSGAAGVGSASSGGSTGMGGGAAGATGGGGNGMGGGGLRATGGAGAAEGGAGGAAAMGGSVGTGTGGALGSGPCDGDFSCPTLGTCALMPEGSGCYRLCSFDPVVHRVTTQDDLAALAALRCDVVAGTLFIDGSFESLAGLETIREVKGELQINHADSLTDFGGLSGLESVTGSVFVPYYPYGTNRLKVMEFPRLKSVDTLSVIGMGQGDTVHSIQMPALQTLTELAVNANPTLTEIQMPALTTVTKVLIISGDVSLTSLDGFPALTSAHQIRISYNDKLPQCAAEALAARVGAPCSCSSNDANGVCN